MFACEERPVIIVNAAARGKAQRRVGPAEPVRTLLDRIAG